MHEKQLGPQTWHMTQANDEIMIKNVNNYRLKKKSNIPPPFMLPSVLLGIKTK